VEGGDLLGKPGKIIEERNRKLFNLNININTKQNAEDKTKDKKAAKLGIGCSRVVISILLIFISAT
jgi:hypothetical protein